MVSYIAVGTPMSASGAADLTAIFKAAEDIAKAITGYHIVAVKSTVPVGTNDRVREIVGKFAKHRADVCSVPEFLKEGSAIEDFMRPDRVVIGSLSEQATADSEGNSQSIRAHRQSDPRDGSAIGRADQVCVERDARDAHLVHQRDGDAVRRRRRRHQCSAPRPRHRQAHRVVVPVSRASVTAVHAFPRTCRR